MQKNLRVQVMQDLYAEIKKSRTGDLSRAVDFLKSAREIRQGKINKRKQVKINYVKRQLIKPIFLFGGRVVQEQHCKWLLNTETKVIIKC